MEPLQCSFDQLVPVKSRFLPRMGVRTTNSTAAAAAATTSSSSSSSRAATTFGLGQSQTPWVFRVLVGVETFVCDLKDGTILDAELQLLQNRFAIQRMDHGHRIANALF